MEENQFSRTEMLIGKENIEKLNKSKIAIFGIGGVGSFVCEGLVRAGIGNFILVDDDKISITNINRQIHATHKTVGKDKVEIEKQRILEINPKANIETHKIFYRPKNNNGILDKTVNYIVDAVDTVTVKIELVIEAKELKIPIISSMGTGNKLDPTQLEISDIFKTEVCPLAKAVRRELKEKNIEKLKVIYSKEEPIKHKKGIEQIKQPPGSISFVPSVAGLIIAREVIKDIIKM